MDRNAKEDAEEEPREIDPTVTIIPSSGPVPDQLLGEKAILKHYRRRSEFISTIQFKVIGSGQPFKQLVQVDDKKTWSHQLEAIHPHSPEEASEVIIRRTLGRCVDEEIVDNKGRAIQIRDEEIDKYLIHG